MKSSREGEQKRKKQTNLVVPSEKFLFYRVFVPKGLDHSWSIDVLFFPKRILRRLRVGCVLCVVENLSHFLWAKTLKNNKAAEIIHALKEIFDSGRKPTTILTDQGGEFQNYKTRQFLTEQLVHLQTVYQAPNKVDL